MNIECTKKLLDTLHKIPEERIAEDAIYSWHANLLLLNRKKAILLVNNATRYAILLYSVQSADYKQLDWLLKQSIRETFAVEKFNPDDVEKYLQNCGRMAVARSSSKSVLATMTQYKYIVESKAAENALNEKAKIQTKFNVYMGKWLTTVDGDYRYPRELVQHALTEHYVAF